jgi:hypothetical protein
VREVPFKKGIKMRALIRMKIMCFMSLSIAIAACGLLLVDMTDSTARERESRRREGGGVGFGITIDLGKILSEGSKSEKPAVRRSKNKGVSEKSETKQRAKRSLTRSAKQVDLFASAKTCEECGEAIIATLESKLKLETPRVKEWSKEAVDKYEGCVKALPGQCKNSLGGQTLYSALKMSLPNNLAELKVQLVGARAVQPAP